MVRSGGVKGSGEGQWWGGLVGRIGWVRGVVRRSVRRDEGSCEEGGED